jgi:hypothetical protein
MKIFATPDGRISAEAGADRRRVTKSAMELEIELTQ